MQELAHILALSEKDLTKLIFAGIFLAIWILGGILSAYAKKKEAERRERVRKELERAQRSAPNWEDVATRPPTFPPTVPPPPPWPPPEAIERTPDPKRRPPPAPQRTVPPVPQRTVPPAPQRTASPAPARMSQQAKRPKSARQRKPPEALPTSSDLNAGESLVRTLVALEPVAEPTRPARRAPAADAKAIHSWLRPATMRQQFILTEILQPPLALRDSRPSP